MTPDPTTMAAWILAAGAISAALVAVWKLVVGVTRFVRRAGRFFDEWFGVEAYNGHDAKPSIPERMDKVETHMAAMCSRIDEVDGKVRDIQHEVRPNHGHSLRDAVDRIEVQLDPDQP